MLMNECGPATGNTMADGLMVPTRNSASSGSGSCSAGPSGARFVVSDEPGAVVDVAWGIVVVEDGSSEVTVVEVGTVVVVDVSIVVVEDDSGLVVVVDSSIVVVVVGGFVSLAAPAVPETARSVATRTKPRTRRRLCGSGPWSNGRSGVP